MRAEAVFTPDLGNARAARRFVDRTLQERGVEAELAVLLVSELATNAVLHARTDFVLRVVADDERVRVEVEDANERRPSIAHTPPEATSGRGLQLLQTLADGWGIEGTPHGKVVWFELAADAAALAARDDRHAYAC